MSRTFIFCASVALTVALAQAAPVVAQQIAPPAGTQVTPFPDLKHFGLTGGDPLADAFFSPEVVMRNQQAIGLTADQRSAIVAAISAAQPRFVEAQWQMEPETAALAQLLQGARVDEGAVLQQIDRVLDIERQIKRIQIEMLVRIKNELTAEQQTQLARLGGVRGLRGLVGPNYMDELNKLIRGQNGLGMGLEADHFSDWVSQSPTVWTPRALLPPGE